MIINILHVSLVASCLFLFSGCTAMIVGTDNCSKPETPSQTTSAIPTIAGQSGDQKKAKDAAKWGPLPVLIGPYWVGELNGYSHVYKYEWMGERQAIKRTLSSPYARGITKDVVAIFEIGPDPGSWIACVNYGEFDRKTTYRLTAEGTMVSDWISVGHVKSREEIRITRENGYQQGGAVGLNGAQPVPYVFTLAPYSPDEFAELGPKFTSERAALNAEVARMVEEERARSRAKSDEFWNNVATGIGAFSQAAAQTSQEYAAQRARTDALNQSIQQSGGLAVARERERIANERVQARLRQQQQAPERVVQLQQAAQTQAAAGNRQAALQAQAAQREAEAKERAAAKDAERQKRLAEQERQAYLNAQQQTRQFAAYQPSAGSASADAPVRIAAAGNLQDVQASSNKQDSKLAATPEAVMVCTKPEGPRGNFKCSNPLNIHTGHSGDVTGARTPEEMVRASLEVCPNPRELESPTHLVWGCGFGATGFMNAKDRSAGVTIYGRNTYYCTPQQSSCRRTEP